MSIRVTVTWGDAGVIAVKAALTPDQISDLAWEAARLRQASHPGVVALVEHRVTADQADLRTEFAGEPLSRWRGTVARAVGLVAAVAATLADLHEIGVVHGRIDQTHVLVGADGRPRLCGFSPPPGDASPANDVAALGRLLEALGERAVRTDRRRPGAFLWARAKVADHRALRQLVEQATDPRPPRRPSARALARSILAAFPDAELGPPSDGYATTRDPEPFPEEGDDPPELDDPDDSLDEAITEVFGDQTTAQLDDLFVDRPWRSPDSGGLPSKTRGRPAHVIGIVGTIGLAAVAAGALALRATTPSDADAPEPPAVPSPATGRLCASAGQPTADVDGDGCPDPVTVTGSVVEVAGQRWTVGGPGDAVTVGDWDCDGLATPAVYRPSTGDVFVFSSWADTGRPVAAEAVAHVEGGRGVSAAAHKASEDGCDAPVVDLIVGGQHVVDVTP